MPVYQKKALRQSLGQLFLRDTQVLNTAASYGPAGSVFFLDPTQANTAFSGERLYARAYLYHPDTQQTFRCASFNCASGAYVTAQVSATTIQSGSAFEVHELLSPAEKNLCLDRVVDQIPVVQEVGIPTVDGARFYNLEAAASPNYLRDVLDCWYYADPSNSLDRQRGQIIEYGIETTGSGRELRISPALAASQQIIVRAIVNMTLGSTDAATLNLPNDELLLWGATARAYQLLIARSPGQEAGQLKERQGEALRAWQALRTRYTPQITKRIGFGEQPTRRAW